MNETVLRSGVPAYAGKSRTDAWNRLSEVQVPVMVACGDLDVPFLKERSEELAHRLPIATYRTLEGVAHLSELEAPAMVIALLDNVLALA